MKTRKNKQIGVTLFEIILVISLMSLMLAGGLNVYQGAAKRTKQVNFAREIETFKATIRTMFPRGNYKEGDLDAKLLSYFAPNLVKDGKIMRLSYGNRTRINLTTGGGNQSFEIFMYGCSKSDCVSILTTDYGAYEGGNLSIRFYSRSLPVSVKTALKKCNRSNTVYLEFQQ